MLFRSNTGTSRYTVTASNVAVGTTWRKYVLPLPLPAKLTAEKGMFFLAEGPESGFGCTIWFSDIQYEYLGTVVTKGASIQPGEVTADEYTPITVSGAKASFRFDNLGAPDSITVDLMSNYLDLFASPDSVAKVVDGAVKVVGPGDALITAKLGTITASGAVLLHAIPGPRVAAATPTLPAASVQSLFSNAYTNKPVDSWSASWDIADVADVQIAGNDTKKYSNLSYAGVLFEKNPIDASNETKLHLDVYAPQGTTLYVKLVDFGANAVYNGANSDDSECNTYNEVTAGQWTSLEIPLADMMGSDAYHLKSRAHLAQLILASPDAPTLYVDNVYFHH